MTIVDNRLINNLPDDKVFVTASGINKTLRDAIQDGDIGGGGGGGAGIVEIFNHVINLGSNASTLTGLNYFMAPQNLAITKVRLLVYQKNGVSSGNLEIDIKTNTTPDDTGMTSILSAKPLIDFSTALDFDIATGTISTASIPNNNFLRLDVTSIPAGWLGKFQVICYAE
jgi:hypothetical protein